MNQIAVLGSLTLGGSVQGPETVSDLDLRLALAHPEYRKLIVPFRNYVDFNHRSLKVYSASLSLGSIKSAIDMMDVCKNVFPHWK